MHQQQGALPGSSPQRPLRTLLKALQAAGIGVAATFAGTAGAAPHTASGTCSGR